MDLLFWPCFPVSGPESMSSLVSKLLDGSWPTCLQKEFSIWVDPSSDPSVVAVGTPRMFLSSLGNHQIQSVRASEKTSMLMGPNIL